MEKNWLALVPMTVLAGLVFGYGGSRVQSSPVIATENNEVSVAAQFIEKEIRLTSDKQIEIKGVTFATPGFIVVQEDADGKTGKIIGTSLFLSKNGRHNVLISVDRVLIDGEILYMSYYEDNGDSQFDPSQDKESKDIFDGGSYIKFAVVKNNEASGGIEPRL